MGFVTTRIIAVSAASLVLLAACEEGQFASPPNGDDVQTVTPPQEARVEIRDVERGDIFNTSELALWDGRPSLGGIWVAHPDVGDPERVRIENTTNGQIIEGALFRRERANPGPRIQLSSDAAAALSILAGQPTEVALMVLRTEEVVIEPAPLPVEIDDDSTEVSEPEAPAETDEAPLVAVTSVDMGADTAPPKRPGFWASLREALGGAPADETAPLVDNTSSDASAPNVETEALDPIAAASAAIDEAEATALSAEATPAARPARTTTSELQNPYVQVGLFSVEANADAAAASLRQGGIVPTVVPGNNGDRQFWRVIVGPMTTPNDQAQMLGQVRALGYADAFLTPN
ncbi:MAG: SPOR domain-containing protein [Boseongicola sp.]|nr:MAG: SPOR domain-containing protein [Boseongicola sp.]